MGFRLRIAVATIAVVAVVVVASPVAVPAEPGPVPARAIAGDFRPVEGYVVGARGGRYVVDLGAKDGLRAGDLLAVLAQSEPLTHPVTGERIPGLRGVRSVLRVTRVDEEVSSARPVGAGGEAGAGDPVVRYGGLTARFRDRTGTGESSYLALRKALPHLEWLGYSAGAGGAPDAGEEADLVFELHASRLEVRGAGGGLIRAYALGPDEGVEPSPLARRAPPAPAPEAAGKGYRPEFSRSEPAGTLGGHVRIAGFLRTDGDLLLASTDGHDIRVHALSEEGAAEELVRSGAGTAEVLSVHWWTPGPAEVPYLAATRWDGETVSSAVYAFRGGRLELVRRGIADILASFDLDQDGRPETLLGQSFVRDGFFGPRVREYDVSGARVVERRDEIALPAAFAVQGATFTDLTGDGRPELAFVRDRMLRIHAADGTLLYRSPPQIGGSLSSLHYEVDPEFDFSPVNTVPFEIAPVAVDIDGDGLRELIAVAAERPLVAFPGAGSAVKRSWLAVFDYRDGGIVKGRLGPEHEASVQGLMVTEDAILLVAPASNSVLGAPGPSRLIALPVAGRESP